MMDQQNHERFISILERNIGMILKISRAFTNTVQDREDLVHDIAFEMWKSFPGFKGNSKVSTWIYRVALNTAMNYKRDSRKKRDFLQGAIEISSVEPIDQTDPNPHIEILYDCIAELDAFSKAIVLLYLDGYRHEEIAEITGISKSNVGTRISRIKEQLKSRAKTKQDSYGT
jgi:RNA polymerase sigma-70 factor (ECF subfamily)